MTFNVVMEIDFLRWWLLQGDLHWYLSQKGQLELVKAVRYALDIARYVYFLKHRRLLCQMKKRIFVMFMFFLLWCTWLRMLYNLTSYNLPVSSLLAVETLPHTTSYLFYVCRGLNYLHEWKPEAIIHSQLRPR